MDIEKYLIILKGEDKTANIRSYKYQKEKVFVRFKNPDKTYGYSRNNFEFYTDPIEISVDDVEKTLCTGDIYNVKKILCFDSYCRIIFDNGSSTIVKKKLLTMRPKTYAVSEDRFNYFKDISKIVSVITEDGISLLTKEYEKVNFVEKNTALYQYLNPEDSLIKNKNNNKPLIFPFGSNESQYKAVENAMNSQISVIEGPPGTGKTQTILNIIANIVTRGKTVAVVSNNNSATLNVFQKLSNSGLSSICATLGKKYNKEQFIENQEEEYSRFSSEYVDSNIINYISSLNKRLDEIFKLKNIRANYYQILNEVKTEHKYHNKYYKKSNKFKVRKLMSLSSNTIMRLKVFLEDNELNNGKVGLWFKLKASIIHGIGKMSFYKLPIKDIIENYNELYFFVKEKDLLKQINKISERLNYSDDKGTLEELKKYSNMYLMSYLNKKYLRKNL